MISLSGTFDYLVIIPEARNEGGVECLAETGGPVVRKGSNSAGARLVGFSPQVRVTDAGSQSDPGLRPPWSLRKRSQITLIATARDQALVAEASFYIDKTFTDRAEAGDQMHLSRDQGCGLAFSLIRSGKLVAAAGALTAVPLGNGVEARIPLDLISTAEKVFQGRDPEFKFIEQPVEIKIEGVREQHGQHLQSRPTMLTDSFLSFGGGATIGDYRVIVRHGSFKIPDGLSESVSICNKQAFTHAAGEFAAMLLDGPEALSMCRWPEERH